MQLKILHQIGLIPLHRKFFSFQIRNRTSDTLLTLTPTYVFISELYTILYNCGGQVLYSNLEDIYRKTHNKNLDVSHLNCTSVADFLQTFKSFFVLKGNKRKLQLMLNKQLAGELCNLDSTSS